MARLDRQSDRSFEELLEFLRAHRGFDFTGYKRASLARRVRRRMQQLEIGDDVEYLDRLQVDQREFVALFNTILIDVTGFFRDLPSWRLLQAGLLDEIVDNCGPTGTVRVWSTGCATGEEAYTLAILLAEKLGLEQFRERVKIYATDVDEAALTRARAAVYTDQEAGGCPPEYLEKYFEKSGSRYVLQKDLREGVVFGRTDLVQDAPISRVDLIACRNTLVYFNAETQAHVLDQLYCALNLGGVLFLGRAEMSLAHASLFRQVDLRSSFFRKVAGPAGTEQSPFVQHSRPPARVGRALDHVLRDQALFSSPTATVVVSADNRLTLSNGRADALFDMSQRDIGRPFQDIESSYRPVELHSLLRRATTERRPIWVRDVEWSRPGGDRAYFDVQLIPLINTDGTIRGVSIHFNDVSRYHLSQAELAESTQQLETAYEELQSTVEELEAAHEELQSTMTELESTNQELQSTMTELKTTNQELRFANEELETRNEELRNEELQSTNDKSRARTGELDLAD